MTGISSPGLIIIGSCSPGFQLPFVDLLGNAINWNVIQMVEYFVSSNVINTIWNYVT